jgi:CheY-like chemotaxis protein
LLREFWALPNPEEHPELVPPSSQASDLPVPKSEDQSIHLVPQPVKAKALRILVVDDHESVRKEICALLRREPGIEVICEAVNGLEGVRYAAELQPDVIVLDITMPVLGGIEAAVRIHRLAPKSQIVFLSQHDAEKVAQAALATGALGYVTKIAVSTDLIPAVKAVSEGKKFVSKFSVSHSLERKFWLILPWFSVRKCPRNAGWLKSGY